MMCRLDWAEVGLRLCLASIQSWLGLQVIVIVTLKLVCIRALQAYSLG